MKRSLSALFGLGLMLSPAGELFAHDNHVHAKETDPKEIAPKETV